MSYVENKYPCSMTLDALKNFVNLKQTDDKSLVNYTKRFKSAKKIMETQLGCKLELLKTAKLDPKWMEISDPADLPSKDNKKGCKTRAYKRFITFLYLENANRSKYGSLLSGLATQYSRRQDHPLTVEEATNVLLNHKFDQAFYDNKKKRLQGNSNSSNQQRQSDCQGHNEGNDTSLSFVQMENRCYCYGSPAHKSPKCPKKDSILRLEWKINQTPKL